MTDDQIHLEIASTVSVIIISPEHYLITAWFPRLCPPLGSVPCAGRDRDTGTEERGTSVTQRAAVQAVVPAVLCTQRSSGFVQRGTGTKPAESPPYFSRSRDLPGTSSNLLLAFF